MQIRLTFRCNGLKLPVSYHYILQGIIYRALSESPVYSGFIHDNGYRSDGKSFKLFTFSQLMGRYILSDGFIEFPYDAHLEIRGSEPQIIGALYLYFSNNKTVNFDKSAVAIKECILDDFYIRQNEIKVEAISPVVAYVSNPDKSTVFFDPTQKEFYSLIKANARRKYACKADGGSFDFEILPSDGAFKKHVTKFKSTIITGYTGRFILKGDASILTFLYNTGLGAKNSQGFGMFNLF